MFETFRAKPVKALPWFYILLDHIDDALTRHREVNYHSLPVRRRVRILHQHFFIMARTRSRSEEQQVIQRFR